MWCKALVAATLLAGCGGAARPLSRTCYEEAGEQEDPVVEQTHLARCDQMAGAERDDLRRAIEARASLARQRESAREARATGRRRRARSAGAVSRQPNAIRGYDAVRLRMHFPPLEFAASTAPGSGDGRDGGCEVRKYRLQNGRRFSGGPRSRRHRRPSESLRPTIGTCR